MQTMTLNQMKNIDIRTVNLHELVDIRDVKINPDKLKEERIAEFVKQIKNPYCYKVGKTIVKLSFAENGVTLEDKLESLFIKQ